ncbi:uncharacterized protein LOC136086425 [Hydra vulgaris]|uniref:Uncharacterized protein LOC136086425 n=1 Tax=Hydra vulgaris TaxID=6087 RepID=A0ABM4CSC0_HYDVU
MTTSGVLNFTEMPIVDNGIKRFQFYEYEPVNGVNLHAGDIRINIEQQDLFKLPSEVFLLFEGQLVKADGTTYANTDVVALTNNGIMHLFNQITYELLNQDIEAVYCPGHLFGFCDDYGKVIYGLKHTITLVRQSYDDAVFKLAGVAAGKVNLKKISLFMLHVIPSDLERSNLYQQIEKKATLPVSFRRRQCETISVPQATSFSWRLSVKTSPENPRYIIAGFQTNKSGDQNANPSISDHCDLNNMYIILNQDRYPVVDYNLSFPNQ